MRTVPSVGSTGLESGTNYLRQQPVNILNLSVSRIIPLAGSVRSPTSPQPGKYSCWSGSHSEDEMEEVWW
jgi:hypothetical protein